jgi:hypothetical protein
MSSFAYGVMTRARNVAPAEESKTTKPPGTSTYVDALAALVPAEVLAAHAVILQATTTTTSGDDASATIEDPSALKWAFWGLLVVSALLFVLGLAARPKGFGILRVAIPPLAFVGWTMLVQPSAFDAVFDLGSGARTTIAVVASVVLTAVAARLAKQADEAEPRDPGA